MRQAGRYLPEYNATRAAAGSFLALAKTPGARHRGARCSRSSAFRSTRRSCFSDILTIPDAMGLGLRSPKAKARASSGRCATKPRSASSRAPDLTPSCATCFDAVREIRRRSPGRVPLDRLLRQPVHARLLHGRRLRAATTGARSRRMLHSAPDLLHRDPRGQRARGRRLPRTRRSRPARRSVMIFDTWGGIARARRLRDFLARLFTARSCKQRDSACRSILFTKGGNPWLAAMMQSGLRRDRPRLDERSARSARTRRRTRRAAGQSRSGRALRTAAKACAPQRARASMHSARRRDMSSISATASCRRRRSIRLQRW